MKARLLAAALLLASTPALAQTEGWTLEAGTGTAILSHGAADAPGAFRFECNGANTMFTTWTRNPPRNVGDAEYATSVSFFLGRTERAYAGTGRPGGNGSSRIDAPITDAPTLLDSARRNGRLVVVTHAGRSTAPAPAQADVDKFGLACATAPRP